ncbi:MAG TPA: asparagine synthase-related protein, partial [Sphingomicrobium sp.]|nr:asparagine synthase-related protein [Sphingomicrobium sp.]
MIAFAWPKQSGANGSRTQLCARIGASLCAGIGGHAGAVELAGLHFAHRPLRSSSAASRAWRPSTLPSGRIGLFQGYFDNAAEIAAQLGTSSDDLNRLYGLAVERWGRGAEQRIIGDYCSLLADPGNSTVRLSRSPLRAPPLYYFHGEHLTAAASVPRALFASGVETRVNEARIADIAMRNFSDEEASAFEGVLQVPLGSIVELAHGEPRDLDQWYDLLGLPFQEVTSDAAVIARAGELLDEGIRACLGRFGRPGATLSGGLDSSQVAVRALAAIPSGERLPTFTFHPEPGFDGRVPSG